MEWTTRFFIASISLAVVLVPASSIRAEITIGDYTISGSAEVDGLPRSFSGDKTRFEEYRDIPESLVVPQLELMIGTKKNDFFFDFNAGQVGRDDQNYRMRFGRYGLFNVELEWDQIPAAYNIDNARTPYMMNRNSGTYTLRSRPTADDAATFSNWINDPNNTRSVNLDLLNKIGKVSINYTPTPGWSFIGKYWSQNTDGKRAISFPFGTGSSSGIAELAEPIDYQTHNIELGGEYAGKGWSVALRYNGSLFHNSISTLVFDNPAAIGPGCTDAAIIDYNTGAGPCRGRVDLFPSNQAHMFSLVGTASLPFKTQFLGTVSYGWRLQDDSFLPFTINSAIANPTLSRNSLEGDVRPTNVNLTLINNSITNLNLKAYYRFYDLDNRTKSVTTDGTVLNDQLCTINPNNNNPCDPAQRSNEWTTANFYSYSRNTVGFQSSYHFTRWLTGKFNVNWDKTHRSIPQLQSPNESVNNSEVKIGPTFDIKPLSWLLLRASYQRSWRTDQGYNGEAGREMYFLTSRNRNKVSLFTDISPWETLSFHAGFDFIGDDYPEGAFGVQSSRGYSPSVGFLYAPLEWLKFFGDYNYDRTRWNQDYNATIRSHGIDRVNTFSLGSDVDIIKNLLGLRIQYGYSQGFAQIVNNNNVRWPDNSNTWHELLARLEYKFHKNVSAQLGYYFNKFHSKDYGVDIMRLWMGDQDTNSGQLRSVYLGDQFKGSYTAHVAMIGLKFKF